VNQLIAAYLDPKPIREAGDWRTLLKAAKHLSWQNEDGDDEELSYADAVRLLSKAYDSSEDSDSTGTAIQVHDQAKPEVVILFGSVKATRAFLAALFPNHREAWIPPDAAGWEEELKATRAHTGSYDKHELVAALQKVFKTPTASADLRDKNPGLWMDRIEKILKQNEPVKSRESQHREAKVQPKATKTPPPRDDADEVRYLTMDEAKALPGTLRALAVPSLNYTREYTYTQGGKKIQLLLKEAVLTPAQAFLAEADRPNPLAGKGRYAWTPQEKWNWAWRQANLNHQATREGKFFKQVSDAEKQAVEAKLKPKINDNHLPEDVKAWIDEEARAWYDRKSDQARKDNSPENRAKRSVQQDVDDIEDHYKKEVAAGHKPQVSDIRRWADESDMDEYHPLINALIKKLGL
jgi:hypothetical protein